MWSEEIISFVIQCCRERDHASLRDRGNLHDFRAAIEQLCDDGEFFHNTGLVRDDEVRRRKESLFLQYPIEGKRDPEKVLALLFFQIGVEHRRTHVQTTSRPLPVSVTWPALAACDREEHAANQKSRVDEEHFSAELAKAQQARWGCRYGEVSRRLTRLHSALSETSGVVGSYWRTKLLDLQVEVTFTIGKRPKSARVLEQTETAIKGWAGLHEPVPLMHAHLRKSVIYRQMFTESQARRRPVDSHLYDSLLALYQAEEEVLPDLKRSITLDARATAFAFYNDLAKTLSHARQFDRAKRYLQEAQGICNELEERDPRRALNLLITRAVFIRECLLDKRIFGHVSHLDQLDESMNNGATHCLEFDDVVLSEQLLKSQIPVLAGTGRREEAEEILKRCQVRARHHRLYNQQRDLLYLASSLRLGSAYK